MMKKFLLGLVLVFGLLWPNMVWAAVDLRSAEELDL